VKRRLWLTTFLWCKFWLVCPDTLLNQLMFLWAIGHSFFWLRKLFLEWVVLSPVFWLCDGSSAFHWGVSWFVKSTNTGRGQLENSFSLLSKSTHGWDFYQQQQRCITFLQNFASDWMDHVVFHFLPSVGDVPVISFHWNTYSLARWHLSLLMVGSN